MKFPFQLMAAGALLALAGCNSLPTYAPAPADKTVTARFIGDGRPYMCVDGKSYKLNVIEDQGKYTAQLPVNKRVMLWTYQSYSGYQVTSSCMPSLSIVPKEGSPVVVNSGLDAGKCFIESVREDSSRPAGVAMDPTLGAPRC